MGRNLQGLIPLDTRGNSNSS